MVCWRLSSVTRYCIQSRVDINSLYRGRFYVWAPGLCSLYRGIRYIEVLFHTFYCNFGRDIENRSLYRGVLYIEGRYIEEFVISRFYTIHFTVTLVGT